jgi:hypothetical protein
MAHLGNEMVCGHGTSPQSCPIHIATRLALRYDNYDLNLPDDPGSNDGGHQGRIGDLAIAILAEIEHWQHTQPEAKLILNLSIGWDEYQDPARRAELETSERAVYDALDYARELGVLVIVAAGNRSGGQVSQVPFFPAVWESTPPSWFSGFLGKKVAYAIGGVDWQGLPLPNARPVGMPKLVAYADHVVVKTSDGSPTRIYTGSSVSTVVASSAAAMAWHLKPSLTPEKVMEQIALAAEESPSTATYYAGRYWESGSPPPKRLSPCKTVLSLCGLNAGLCPAVTSITCPQDHDPADFSTTIIPQHSSPVTFSSIDPPSCDLQTQVYMDSGLPVSPKRSCPIETLPDMNTPGLTYPQPPETPCPPCTIVPTRSVLVASLTPSLDELTSDESDASYSLAAAIDPEWLKSAGPDMISSAILVVECSTGSPIKERLDLTPQFTALLTEALAAAGSTTPPPVKRIGFGPIEGRASIKGCTASVDFTLRLSDGAERSVQSPVYVDP